MPVLIPSGIVVSGGPGGLAVGWFGCWVYVRAWALQQKSWTRPLTSMKHAFWQPGSLHFSVDCIWEMDSWPADPSCALAGTCMGVDILLAAAPWELALGVDWLVDFANTGVEHKHGICYPFKKMLTFLSSLVVLCRTLAVSTIRVRTTVLWLVTGTVLTICAGAQVDHFHVSHWSVLAIFTADAPRIIRLHVFRTFTPNTGTFSAINPLFVLHILYVVMTAT